MDISTIIYPVAALTGLAVLGEATTEIVKTVIPAKLSENGTKVLALGVSLGLAATLDVSILSNATPVTHYVGVFLAGLVASRGSNYVHTLGSMIDAVKTNLKDK